MGLIDSLEHVQEKWREKRFFLLPPGGAAMYVELHETTHEAHEPHLTQADVVQASVPDPDIQITGSVFESDQERKEACSGKNSGTCSLEGKTHEDEHAHHAHAAHEANDAEADGAMPGMYADLAVHEREDAQEMACAAYGWSVRPVPRRVYDCVNYFQEDKMLLLRMHELVRFMYRSHIMCSAFGLKESAQKAASLR